MRFRAFLIAVLAVAVVGCGGGDDTTPSASDPTDTGAGSGGGGDVSASFVSGDVTLTATETTSCSFGDLLDVKAQNGDDWFSVFDAQGQVFIRAFIDGQEWVDNGDPAKPEVAGRTVTWSGELNTQGAVQDAEISISC